MMGHGRFCNQRTLMIHPLLGILLNICMLHTAHLHTSPLGKTHFIIGYEGQVFPSLITPNHLDNKEKITRDIPFNLIHDNKINAVLFSPDDKVHTVLEYLIAQEKQSIRLAIFAFTDKKIAQALIDARKRGVHVEIITDTSSVYGKYNKLSVLHDGNITIHIYNPEKAKTAVQGLMHNKFFLFKDNILGKSLLWTGSFNVTVAASKANRENVLVSEEILYLEKFTQEFDRLKTWCDYYRKPNTDN
jgi:phosphatidylserine/phosphatidylglycerophosphate/cardiolipin synthase-like enzyme